MWIHTMTRLCFSLACLSLVVSSVRADDAGTTTFVPVEPKATIEFTTGDREKTVPEPFHLKPHSFPAETKFIRESGPVKVYQVTFPSPVQGDIEENNTVWAEYYLPAGNGPFPAAIVLHILGGDFPLSQMVANSLARKGVAALFIKMPYYGERRSKTIRRRMISRNPDEIVEGMTQAVLDIRRGAAWLKNRPEVDKNRLGITGISLGGIMSALSAPALPDFHKVAIYLGGGELHRMLWERDDPQVAEFRNKWIADGGTRESFIKKMKVVDPANYGHLLVNRDVLMVNADHDEIIPREATLALWESMNRRPELIWLNAGHISASKDIFSEVIRLQIFFTHWDDKARAK